MAIDKEILLLIVGFGLSIIAGLIGAYLHRVFMRYGDQKPLNQILNFGEDALFFAFPQRKDISSSILPRTSTEDFLAMNNVISALIAIGWKRKIGVRDPIHIDSSNKKRNVVIVCSPKSNEFSLEFQKKIHEKAKVGFWFEKSKGKSEEWFITDGDSISKSKSYEQEREYIKQGCTRAELASKYFEDYGVITKVTNPWNSRNRVVVVAGIRGIGTWGAAECLKKEWKQIYTKLNDKNKSTDFSALVRVSYNNCDITTIKVVRVVEFELKF